MKKSTRGEFLPAAPESRLVTDQDPVSFSQTDYESLPQPTQNRQRMGGVPDSGQKRQD